MRCHVLRQLASFFSGIGSVFSMLPITYDMKSDVICIVFQLINSLGTGIYSTVSRAMMGDAIDDNERKTGKRKECALYALHSFFRKLAQGVGPVVALVVMTALGYVGAKEGNQLPEVANRMRYLVPGLYLISAVMQFVGLSLIYNLDKKSLAVMNEELAARHAMKGRYQLTNR